MNPRPYPLVLAFGLAVLLFHPAAEGASHSKKHSESSGGSTVRRALVIGNQRYPGPAAIMMPAPSPRSSAVWGSTSP